MSSVDELVLQCACDAECFHRNVLDADTQLRLIHMFGAVISGSQVSFCCRHDTNLSSELCFLDILCIVCVVCTRLTVGMSTRFQKVVDGFLMKFCG